jgi:LacI family transcriptional regulator
VKATGARSRVTARDVATLVPCSVATVSLVVNGKSAGRVNAEIEKRVWQAVRQLDYRVNSAASALARGTPNTVALVFPDPTNPFFSLVLDGVISALGDELTLTVVAPSGGDDYRPRTVQRAMAGDLAGLILASPGPTLLDNLTPTCPIIVLDAAEQYSELATINPDIATAARDLAEHLVGLGHRCLAYVGLQRDKETLLYRRDALHTQLTQRGAHLAVPDVLVERISIGDAHQAFLARWPDLDRAGVTAVICGDDLLAYGTMTAANACGVDVPGRLSIAGFNNLPYSAMVAPSLTTIDLSARELGIRAVALLRSQLDGRLGPASEMLPSRLVVRRSTGLRSWGRGRSSS